MTLTAADIRADFDLYDFQTTATVQSVDADTATLNTSQSGVKVLKRVTSKSEVDAGDGSIPRTVTRIHLKASSDTAEGELAFEPKERDVIGIGSTAWLIQSVEVAAAGSRYVCEVTKYPS